jgi:hypothetical protein
MYDIDAAVVLGLTYPPLYSGSPKTNKIFMGGNELCCRGKEKKRKNAMQVADRRPKQIRVVSRRCIST